MTEQQLSLSPFYAGWDFYQQQLAAAIAPLSPEQLALRASPQHWSVGMLAMHIVSTRVWWFHEHMGEGSSELVSLESWDEHFGEEGHEDEPVRPAAEIVAGLEATWQMIQATLAHSTPADLGQTFPHPYKPERPAHSRQWIIWHVLEHDIHHGGELSLILGAHGLPGVDLD